MNVEPTLSIHAALARCRSGTSDFVGFVHENLRYVVYRDDLERMDTMGMGAVPVEAVAMPETSPLLFSEQKKLVASEDYSRQLTRYFPVYFVAALYEMQSLILRFGAKGYVIGGVTRDLLLYHEKRLTVRDVDVAIEGDAIALSDFLAEHSRNFHVLERYPEFGTAKLEYKNTLLFDVASTRREIYAHCGALPVIVERGVPLETDVIRRDFTINALAFSIHELGRVLDYAYGLRDVEKREIRVLHPVSFFEDPSRILRALKFCARFDFTLGDETHLLATQFLCHGIPFYKGGGERIKQELRGFLNADESEAKRRKLAIFMREGFYRLLNTETNYTPTAESIERMTGVGTLLSQAASILSHHVDRDFAFNSYLCFIFADMPEDDFQKTAQRLGLLKAEREAAEQFRRWRQAIPERFGNLHELSSPAEIYDMFVDLPFITAVACLLNLGLDENEAKMRIALSAFATYKRKWEQLSLALNGNDLIALGVPPGKLVGRLLHDLLHAKLVGRLPERLDEIRFVKQVLISEGIETEPIPQIAILDSEAEVDADHAGY